MEPGATPDRKERFPLVDSMRAIAAVSVLFYHVAFRFKEPRSEIGRYISQWSAGPPITAVVLFFLISGFVLYRPFVVARYDGQPLPALVPYAVRRAARIVPGYWLALLVLAVWLSMSYVFTPGGLIRYFGFLQLYARHSTQGGGIPVAWTLCVEVSFYAALPAFAWIVRRLGARRSLLGSELTLCAALAAISLAWSGAACAIVTNSLWKLTFLSVLPGSLDLFAAGMALAVLSVEVTRRPRRRGWLEAVDRAPWLAWVLGLAALYAEGQVPRGISYTGWWYYTDGLKLIGCALLLVPVVFGEPHRGLLRKVLGSRPLLWLGAVSYGIYLWHYSLLQKLAPHLLHHGEVYTTAALAAITIPIAALSYYLVERPAQRLAKRYLKAREAGAGRLPFGPAARPAPPSAALASSSPAPPESQA